MQGNFISSFFRGAALSVLLIAVSGRSFGQCTILPNAIQRISYSYVQGGGTNASGVAYNPNFNIYYAVIAGNPGFPYETFDANGVSLYQTNGGFDFRGLWWNLRTNEVETTGFSNFGLWTSNLNASGYALNTGTNIYTGQNQPDVQSCGDFDCADNEIVYYFSGSIYRYSRPTGALLGSYALTGIPVPIGNINSTSVVYTGCTGQEIGLEDYIGKQILLFNKANGAYVGASQLPATAVTNTSFRFSYANDMVWLYDVNTRKWTSYSIFSGSPAGALNLGNDTTLCTGQILVLDAGNPGATYLWQDGSTHQTLTVTQPGQYSVVVTTVCTVARDTIVVSYSGAGGAVNLGNDTTLCNGNTLLLNATVAGATYQWQDGSTNATYNVTTAGNYSVTATIAGGCTSTDAINVAYVSAPVVNLGNDTALCQGQTLTLDATTAGATYVWQDASTNATYNVTAAGNYSVTVSIGSCTATDAINVTYSPQPVVNLGNDTTLCTGQTLLLDATTAGATYQWQDASTSATFNVTGAGTYSVTVTVNTCTATDAINVTYSAPLAVNLGNDTALCQGQTLLLDATTAGATYVWQDASANATFNVTAAGNYSVTVTVNTCTASDAINVTYSTPPVVNLGNDTALCGGQTLLLNATTANATYVWQDASTNATFNVTVAGNYSVTVTVNACTASDVINVTYNPSPVVNLGNDTVLCQGQTLLLDATTAGATYTWQDASTNATYNVSTAGAYSVTVTLNTCTVSDLINVTYLNPSVNLGNDTSLCAGQSLVLNASTAGTTYQWQDASTNSTYNVTTAGNYAVTITVNGCTATDAINVAALTPPTVAANVTCSGPLSEAFATATGTGPFTYNWSTGGNTDTIITPAAGNYVVTVSDNAGCTASAAISVGQVPAIRLEAKVKPACGGQNSGGIDITVTGMATPFHFAWSNGETNQNISNVSTGQYTLTATDANGCSVVLTDSVTVDPIDASIIVVPDTIIPLGGIATLTVQGTDIDSVFWTPFGLSDPNGFSFAVSPLVSTQYNVTVTSQNGCVATVSVNITVKKVPTWFIPNVFSPNGDGNNDFFNVLVTGPVEILRIAIYDRIGEKVYEQLGGFGPGWDGRYKDQLVPPGVFVYYVQLKNSFPINAETVDLKGTLTVIR